MRNQACVAFLLAAAAISQGAGQIQLGLKYSF